MIMGQDLHRIKNTYDTVAEEYAAAFTGEHEKKPEDRKILLRFTHKIGSRKPVWDLGCGPGQTAEFLKNLGLKISGLDISEKLLEQAAIIHPDIHFQKGNILELEFAGNSISGAVAFYSIVHFTEEQVKTAFSEVFRVLEPGGIFLFTFHIGSGTIHIEKFLDKKVDIDFMFFSCDFIINCLDAAGFKNIELIEREPYSGIEYESRRAYVFAEKEG